MNNSISAIVLAGGTGNRFGTSEPKQFLDLNGKPVVAYALELLLSIEEIDEVIVVSPKRYRHLIEHYPVRFADPGARRQDSLRSGFLQAHSENEWLLTHDAARPLIRKEAVLALLEARKSYQAATLARRVASTIKEAKRDSENFLVNKTLDRSLLWEIETPQLLHRSVLEKGFALAEREGLELTDDVALAELVGADVALIPSSCTNIKLTLKDDLKLISALLRLSV